MLPKAVERCLRDKIMNTRVIFSDVNPEVLTSSNYELVINEDSIRASLETIFTTPVGSRVFNRLFGCRLMDLLFDPMDNVTALLIGREMESAAKLWEPRIKSIEVKCVPDIPNQQYYVEVAYIIPKLGNKMVSYNFNISRSVG